MGMAFSSEQLDRYSRQIVLKQIGGTGQVRLLQSRVALHGAGPAMRLAALYLAGAGVGCLGLGHHQPDKPNTSSSGHSLARELDQLNPETQIVKLSHAKGWDVGSQGPWDAVLCFGMNRAQVAELQPSPTILTGLVHQGHGLVVRLGEVCPGCLETQRLWPVSFGKSPGAEANMMVGLMGSMAATEVMRGILGLADTQGPAGWLINSQTGKGTEVLRCGHGPGR